MAWGEGVPKGHAAGWSHHLLPPILCCVFPLTTEGSWAHLLSWGPVDLVVSNPPYVFHQDMEQLAPEILRCRVGGTGRPGLRRPGGMDLPGAPQRLEGGGGWEEGETAVVLKEKLTLEPTDLLEFSHCVPLKTTTEPSEPWFPASEGGVVGPWEDSAMTEISDAAQNT